MNLFELLVFLVVTAAIGAVGGVTVGFFTGAFARGALFGAIAGPIVVACGIQLYLFISKPRNSRVHKGTRKNEKNT